MARVRRTMTISDLSYTYTLKSPSDIMMESTLFIWESPQFRLLIRAVQEITTEKI